MSIKKSLSEPLEDLGTEREFFIDNLLVRIHFVVNQELSLSARGRTSRLPIKKSLTVERGAAPFLLRMARPRGKLMGSAEPL